MTNNKERPANKSCVPCDMYTYVEMRQNEDVHIHITTSTWDVVR